MTNKARLHKTMIRVGYIYPEGMFDQFGESYGLPEHDCSERDCVKAIALQVLSRFRSPEDLDTIAAKNLFAAASDCVRDAEDGNFLRLLNALD